MRIRPTFIILMVAGFLLGYVLTATPDLWLPYAIGLVLAIGLHVQGMRLQQSIHIIKCQNELLAIAARIMRVEKEAGFPETQREKTGPWG